MDGKNMELDAINETHIDMKTQGRSNKEKNFLGFSNPSEIKAMIF